VKNVAAAVALTVLAGACGGSTSPRASCAAPGVSVDLGTLPDRWVARGRFTLCQEAACATQTSPFTPFYGRGPFLARSIDDKTPVAVTLRVEVDGVQVVHARTAGKVHPSPTERGEVSETCGGHITLELGRDRKRLEERSSS
jgi:hypothetical protein